MPAGRFAGERSCRLILRATYAFQEFGYERGRDANDLLQRQTRQSRPTAHGQRSAA